MALSLLQNTAALAKGAKTIFQGSGGVEPYTYSVLPGGAGGTIDASTGVYTAPDDYGVDTIEVVDSDLVPATAQAEIAIMSPLQLFCDVIKNEMDLDDDQVYIYNQKYNIPTDDRLYIAIGVLFCKPFGNSSRFSGDGDEELSANFQATLSVNILSRGLDALNRKEEIVLALRSVYAQQQMEVNSFYIAPLPGNFVSLSEEDGSAIPFRFNISVAIHYFVKKAKGVEYYDDFESSSIVTEG